MDHEKNKAAEALWQTTQRDRNFSATGQEQVTPTRENSKYITEEALAKQQKWIKDHPILARMLGYK